MQMTSLKHKSSVKKIIKQYRKEKDCGITYQTKNGSKVRNEKLGNLNSSNLWNTMCHR